MRVNITAWCRYRENYSLEITEEYLTKLNEHVRSCYPDVEFEDITAEDVYGIFSKWEWDYPEKLRISLDEWYTLGNFLDEYIRDDVWKSYEDNEYIDMDDWEAEVDFDTAAEREYFEGSKDDAE